MRKPFYFLFAALLWCGLSTPAWSQNKSKPQTKPLSTMKSDANLLRHVVLFKFKDSSTPEQIKSVEAAFSALPGQINTIVDYEWGTNVSPENLAQGFTHCF